MSKKKQELSNLRRQVEILKAQLKYQSGSRETSEPRDLPQNPPPNLTKPVGGVAGPEGLVPTESNFAYLKKDLTKALFLSLLSLGLIFLIYLIQNQIPNFR